jgi:ribonuclease VapC
VIAVDTSALAAIALAEPEADAFQDILVQAGRALISAPNAFELHLALTAKRGDIGRRRAHDLLHSDLVQIVDWTQDHLALAAEALQRFGKGEQHPARLNFGDCMAYATARLAGLPLLYKGNDFAQTDIRSALN